jgi:EAL domain-containing protein (putative c-di-GMP-specific phosphodiesterase class I)/GGDEF domain-containing protein
MRERLQILRGRMSASFAAPSPRLKLLTIGIVLSGIAGLAWLVYATGGVKYAVLHLLYVPIILAALVFGAPGGILAGALAGVLIGPFMPLDTLTGETQYLGNWITRACLFSLVGGFVGLGVGALRRQMATLDWLNEHDARTGLLDRTGLLKAMRRMIGESGGRAQPFLIVVQIRNLLDIQNTFGSAFAEELVKQIGDRGRERLPPDVPIALIQADRLAAVFSSRVKSEELRVEMEMRVREPYVIDRVPVYVDLVIGAAEFQTHASTPEELLQKASIAMHTAVIHKRPFYLYNSATDRTNRENLILLGSIPAALANNEFTVWHQAKVALADGRLSGTEALMRWAHPDRDLILPGDFVPQAEESVLINDLTQWVIGAALADMAAWRARGHSMGVAINLSVRNLHDHALLETLHRTVSQHTIDPQLVDLEITESAVMDDFEYCATLISRLRDRGYLVSIDDFGTGHSSLAYLKGLPVSGLKIDRGFIKRLALDRHDQEIVRTILGLARALNLETTAEGIEDGQALDLLRDWGCTFGQGFHIHRPAPYAKLIEWMEREPSRLIA